ncbi:MAG: patatin-like phospholipase family protein [Verrucomicrobiota bacterium]
MFAAGTNPAEVKNYFLAHRDAFLAEYQLPSLPFAFYKLAVGKPKPLWNDSLIRDMLTHFLTKKGFFLFDDFRDKEKIEVQVISTDLVNSKPRIHTGQENVIEAVLHSSCLPYLFTTPEINKTPLVDGGICENLPVERLRAEQSKYGPVVAISFKKSPPNVPSSILGFSLALVDSAITNSVERSKAMLAPRFVHEIETSVTTFDFATALNSEKGGLGEDYNKVNVATEQFLTSLVKHLNANRFTAPPHWETTDPSAILVMENAYRAYRLIEVTQPIRRLKATFKIIANSLFEDGDKRKGLDQALQATEFIVERAPVSCIAIAIIAPPGMPYLGLSNWHIDRNGTVFRCKKDIIAIPARDPEKPSARRFIFFFDPLPIGDCKYKFCFQDFGEAFMKPLAEGKKDSIGYTCIRQDGHIDVVDLVLHVPQEYRSLSIYDGGLGVRLDERDADHADRSPDGYRFYGWRAPQVPEGKKVQFNIE